MELLMRQTEKKNDLVGKHGEKYTNPIYIRAKKKRESMIFFGKNHLPVILFLSKKKKFKVAHTHKKKNKEKLCFVLVFVFFFYFQFCFFFYEKKKQSPVVRSFVSIACNATANRWMKFVPFSLRPKLLRI